MESSSKIPDLSDTQPMPGEGHLDGEGSGQVVIPLFTAMGALADEEQTSGPEDEVETASPEQDGVNGGVQIETMDSGPTFKHMDFVSEPIGDKAATELPGIGPATGARLTEQGFGLVSHISLC